MGLITGLLLAALATPVLAKPLVREHYSGTDSFLVEDGCGHDWNVEATFSGLFMLKSGRRGDATPYFFDNYRYHEVWTAVDDSSLVFIHEGNAMWKDLHITLVEGTVYNFQALEPGQPSVWRTGDGTLILRDRGSIIWDFTVDTHGDDDLSNDEFLFDVAPTIRGPHPELLSEDLCAALGL
jgi:hypothetical protein